MNVERWTPEGRIDRTVGLRAEQADAIYEELKWMAHEPFAKYYRIRLMDGARTARDTEHEVFGRQTMVPGMIVSYGKTGMAAYMHSDGYAVGFGTGGE